MRLIVGLGNPGRRYASTRHNIGFRVIDALRKKMGDAQALNLKYSDAYVTSFESTEIVLLKPTTYMNRSGLAVLEVVAKWNIPLDCILTVVDDLNLPLKKLRARPKGSAGGQKGLQSIFDELETSEIQRLRIGIGQPDDPADWADYVLQNFDSDEQEHIDDIIERSCEACISWLSKSFQDVMCKFN